jgi:ParB-like nuclease family protein
MTARVQKPITIPLNQIAPLRCARPDALRAYVGMLREGKTPPAILVIRQRRKRYRYRIFDGAAHRTRAARRVGLTTIEARIIAKDAP